MKYLFLLSITLIFSQLKLNAQVARMQLIEEFSDEDVFECATEDPAFNILLANHTNQAIALKYEATTGTEFGFIASTVVSPVVDRRFYYGNITNYPYGLQDGKAIQAPTSANNGKVKYLTGADLANRSTVTSPFSINLSHAFSANFDSIYVTAIITAAQNYTAIDSSIGAIHYRLALVEKEIHVKNATGANRVVDYYNVMRKMIPNADGTILRNSWFNGQSDTITFKFHIGIYPLTYLYDFSQIAFVGFLQDDGYGTTVNANSVLQAAYSAPLPMPSFMADAGLENVTAITSHCIDSITPSFKITNHGMPLLTQAIIAYSTNKWNTSTSLVWNGNLAKDSSAIISFSPIAVGLGNIPLVGKITSVSGHPLGDSQNSFANHYDYNCSNNITNSYLPYDYSVTSTHSNAAILQNFQNCASFDKNVTFTNATLINKKRDDIMVFNQVYAPLATEPLGAYASSSQSLCWILFNFGIYGGNNDTTAIAFKSLDLTTKINTGLRFDYSYAKRFYTSNDTLEVLVSSDCGNTWQSVWLKSGSDLSTGNSDSINLFYPTHSEWQSASVDLRSFDNSPSLNIKLQVIEAGGNALYLDNINLGGGIYNSATELDNQNLNSISVYPNPAIDFIQLKTNSTIAAYEIYSSIGQMMDSRILPAKSSTTTIDISTLANGIYFIKLLDSKGNQSSAKFIKEGN